MARLAMNRSALDIVWTFPSSDALCVKALRDRLTDGHESRLFNLVSWDFENGRARAVLTPEAPLEEILELIWGPGHRPIAITVVPRPKAEGIRKRAPTRQEAKARCA